MDDIPVIDLNDYEKKDKIGGGSYGEVSLVIKKRDSTKYAAKEYKQSFKPNSKDCDFFKEVVAYSKVINPAILKIFGYSLTNFLNEQKPTLILDYMKKGSLYQALYKDQNFPLSKSKKYFILLGSALAMKKLHSIGIIHRDLKPENILLDDQMLPKICDFGCSMISDKELTKIQMEDKAGTPIYMAPEVYSGHSYTYKVDVYSFMLIMYELITEKKPFSEYKNKSNLMKDKKNGKIPDLTKINNLPIQHILKLCLSNDPEKRLSFKEIVAFLMTDEIRKYFNVSYDYFFSYLNLFDDDLKDKDLFGEFDYDKEIDYGNIDAIQKMGINLYFGIGVKKDQEKAAHYFHMASQRRDTNSMFLYARMLQKGRGVQVNKDLALKFYKAASIGGNTNAMLNYAHMFLQGEGVEKNVEKAAYYFKLGGKYGDIGSLSKYATVLLDDLSIYNPFEAGFILMYCSNMGDFISMYYYAFYILKQQNNEENQRIAADLFKKSADSELSDAMISYSYFLWHGIGGKSNKKMAQKYIKKLVSIKNKEFIKTFAFIKSSNNEFTFNVNEIYDHFLIAIDRNKNDVFFNCDFYIAVDDWKIINFLKLARQIEILADNGNDVAMLYYGFLLMYGIGTCSNIEEAISYFKMSADKGNTEGMHQYASAIYLTQKEEARHYFYKSAENGNLIAMFKCAIDCFDNGKFAKAADYLNYIANHEILYENNENIFVFQNIVDKIIESYNNIDEKKIKAIIFNEYWYKGDDVLIPFYTLIIERSLIIYSFMLFFGIGIQENKIEASYYLKKYLIIKSNVFDLSFKNYLESRTKNLEDKIKNGDINAMHKYANMLLNGDGISIDRQKGFYYMKMAADKGNIESMIQYAKMLFKGQNIEINQKEAINYFKIAASKGNKEALKIFGNLAIKRSYYIIDPKERVKYIQKLADIEDSDSMYRYGCILNSAGKKEEAVKYFKKSAYKMNAPSMFKYGSMLYNGDGVEKSEKEGIRFIFLSADMGDTDASFFLGKLIIEKNGLIIDQKEAIKIMEIAFSQENILYINKYGSTDKSGKEIKLTIKNGVDYITNSVNNQNYEAMLFYGNLLIKGDIIKMNKDEGIEYIKKSAYNGNIEAMYQYSKIMLESNDKSINIYEIIEFLETSADQGNVNSMYLYGIMLLKGKIIETNKEKGIYYIKLAINEGNTDAMTKYAKILFKNDKKEKAINYFKKAIDKGNTKAMRIYGNILLKYYNNMEEGIQLIKKSADKEDIKSMYLYGKFLIKQKNIVDGIIYIKKAANLGNVKSLHLFGWLLINHGINQNKKVKGLLYILIAAKKGNKKSLFLYADLIKDFKDKICIEELMNLLKKSANDGDEKSKFYYEILLDNENKETNIKDLIKYLKLSIDYEDDYFILKYIAKLLDREEAYGCIKEWINLIKIAADKGNKYAKVIIQRIDSSRKKSKIDFCECFKNSADQGDIISMIIYSEFLYFGKFTEINRKEAAKYYKMAADKGDIVSMFNYGCMLFNGDGIDIDKTESIKYIKMAADKGNIKAINFYSSCLHEGNGIEKNEKEAIKYFKISANKESPIAMFNYGLAILSDNVEESLHYIKMAADRGFIEAMRLMGIILFDGIIIKMNKKDAARYFKVSVELGDIESTYLYGKMLFNGDDIEMNKEEGIKLIKIAADNGNNDAMVNIASILYEGNGIESDKKEAKKYFQLAIEKGNVFASNIFSILSNEDKKQDQSIQKFENNSDDKKKSSNNNNNECIENNSNDKNKNSNNNNECVENNNNNNECIENDSNDKNKNSNNNNECVENNNNNNECIENDKNKSSYNNNDEYIENNDDDEYEYDDDDETLENEAKRVKREAEIGDINSMVRYGVMLYEGEGVEVNKKEAARYFKMAADMSNTDAIHLYALMLYKGDGIEMNKREAAHYFKIASNMKNLNSCYYYAKMLSEGDGIKADKEEAEKYFKLSYS